MEHTYKWMINFLHVIFDLENKYEIRRSSERFDKDLTKRQWLEFLK